MSSKPTYVNEIELVTEELRAAILVTTTSLGQHGNTILLLQEVDKWLKSIVDVVRNTLRMRATVVLIQILVDVEN